MAAAGQHEDRAVGRDVEARERDRAEVRAGALAQQRVVEQAEDVAGVGALHGAGADRVAGQRGDGGGVGALAADVADDQRPAAVADLEEVVEVAADLVARPAARKRAATSRPGIAGSTGGSRLSCSARAMWARSENSRALASARPPRRANSTATSRSCAS